jgi:hypothetical protein
MDSANKARRITVNIVKLRELLKQVTRCSVTPPAQSRFGNVETGFKFEMWEKAKN